jgi:DNA repair protein SbcC/Rad50
VRNIQPALIVYIAQFAALLHDRQVVIAFHERALFYYLTLELSPAWEQPDCGRSHADLRMETVVTPCAFGFEDDRRIAA